MERSRTGTFMEFFLFYCTCETNLGDKMTFVREEDEKAGESEMESEEVEAIFE